MLFRPSFPDTAELECLLAALSDESDHEVKAKALARLRDGYTSGDDVSQKISQQLLVLLETSEFPSAKTFQERGPETCSNSFFEAMARFPAGALAFPKLCKFIEIQPDLKIRMAAANSLYSQLQFVLRHKEISNDDIRGIKQELKQILTPLLNTTKELLLLNPILSNVYQALLDPEERMTFICQQLGSEQLEVVDVAAKSGSQWIEEDKRSKPQEISAAVMQSLASSAALALAAPSLDAIHLVHSYPASQNYECASNLLSLIYLTEKPTGQPALLAALSRHVDNWLSISSIHALGHSGEEALPYIDLLREFASSNESDKSRSAAGGLQRLSKISGVYDLDSLRDLIHSRAAIQNTKAVTETLMDTGAVARPLIPEISAIARKNDSADLWIKTISTVCSADDEDVWELLEYFFNDVRDDVQVETIHSTMSLLKKLDEASPAFNGEKTSAFKVRARLMISALLIHENDWVAKAAKNAVEYIDNPIAYKAEAIDAKFKYSLVMHHLPRCGMRFVQKADPAKPQLNPSVEKLKRALDSGLPNQQISALAKILESPDIEYLLPLLPLISGIISRPDPVMVSTMLSLRCAALHTLSRFASFLDLWIDDLCKSLDAPVERQFVPFLSCILRECKFTDAKPLDSIFEKLNRLGPDDFDIGFECNLHKPASLAQFLEKGSPTIMAAVAYALCMLDEQSIEVDVLLPTLLAQYPRSETESKVFRTLGGCIPASVGNSRSLFIAAIRRIDPDALDSGTLTEALKSGNEFVYQAAEKLNSLRSEKLHCNIDEVLQERELGIYVESIYIQDLHRHATAPEPVIKALVSADGNIIWTEIMQTSGSFAVDTEMEWVLAKNKLPPFYSSATAPLSPVSEEVFGPSSRTPSPEKSREVIIDFNKLLARDPFQNSNEDCCFALQTIEQRLSSEVNCFAREAMFARWLFRQEWRPSKRYFDWSLSVRYDDEGKITAVQGSFPPSEKEKEELIRAVNAIDLKKLIEREPRRWNNFDIGGMSYDLR